MATACISKWWDAQQWYLQWFINIISWCKVIQKSVCDGTYGGHCAVWVTVSTGGTHCYLAAPKASSRQIIITQNERNQLHTSTSSRSSAEFCFVPILYEMLACCNTQSSPHLHPLPPLEVLYLLPQHDGGTRVIHWVTLAILKIPSCCVYHIASKSALV